MLLNIVNNTRTTIIVQEIHRNNAKTTRNITNQRNA